MTTTLEKPTTKTCPQCQTTIPVTSGYVTWCDQCNWNMHPEKQTGSTTTFEKMYAQAGKKSSQHLLDAMVAAGNVETRFSTPRLFTLMLATLIHLTTLSLLVGGCYLLIAGYPNIFIMFLGAFVLAFFWLICPKPAKLKSSALLKREDFPTLYTIVDEISSQLKAKKVHGILIDKDFNAFFNHMGWRQRRVLGLGLPLVSTLNKQELVALIGHELGHSINGDLNRGFFVRSAIDTLISWYRWIPTRLIPTAVAIGLSITGAIVLFLYSYLLAKHIWINPVLLVYGILGVGSLILNPILWLISKSIYALLFLFLNLNWQDSQRAEFLADRHAATVAGKEAKLSLLTKLHLGDLFQFSISKVVNNKKAGNLWDVFQEQVRNMPERELERMKRVNLLTHARLDTTHPPTANRIAFIESLSVRYPLYELSDEMHKKLMDELSVLKPSIGEKAVADYRNRLYYS